MPRKILQASAVQQYIDAHPDESLSQIAKAFGVDKSSVGRVIRDHHIRYVRKRGGKCSKARASTPKKPTKSLHEVSSEARSQGMSYGQYVALKEGARL